MFYLTATEMLRLLRTRQVSAVELLRAHLRRIEEVNPRVNAVVTLVAERALREAEEADRDLARGRWRGPLHGLPVAHKDLADTAGIRTTYGSPLFADHVPDADSLIVRRMREAGAITVGKTNTPEFGTGSHTVNEIFGATRNPYDLSRSAGGSSGGAAAALASGMVPLADGSDMGGSLRNPASFCNVVGLRPTPGRVPSPSPTAAWFTLGVPGPMARTVEDLALLMSVVAGFDAASPLAVAESGAVFTEPLELDLTGLRVAWSPDLGGLPVDAETAKVTAQAPAVLAGLGARVERVELDLSDAEDAFRTYRAWHYALSYGDLPQDRLGPNVRWNVERGRAVTGADLARAERLRSGLYRRMTAFFDTYDFLIAPVSQVPPFPVDAPYVSEINGEALPDYLAWMRSAYWISVLHAPAASVPCGFTAGGLPVGLQIVGRPFADLRVLRLAHAFERATGHGTRRPTFR
ncbi:amidase [Streptosporangium roseum]|uniref:Amidase n=1 Tax=Streptosporangium roseum (strain ATCC 12428 / DSM 43021 / JCM 3005 / KCTC 9067 / NCIMB 10171 / NRRL 2505 / NI 9100) TaxID=479432 RepID=D2B871_STRRD|nr:amidase [Streptosporangium roseum]ACZ85861.1 Amidase [Streptosporangium roseum DSM 43021]